MLPRPHFEQFWLHFGTPFGTSLGSCWAYLLNVFLMWLFDGIGLHLGSQKTSKMRPKNKRGPKPRPEINWFCFDLPHFGHIQGCWKSSFFEFFFLTPFWDGFWNQCSLFWLTLGSLLETILVTFGVPFLHRFSEDFWGSPKVRDPREWKWPVDSRSANL